MGDCKKCPFYKTEPVPEDLAGKVNLTEWSSCDVDAVGLAAADRIANQSTHIAALQKEIEKLRGGRCPGGFQWRSGCLNMASEFWQPICTRKMTVPGSGHGKNTRMTQKMVAGLMIEAGGMRSMMLPIGCRCRTDRRRRKHWRR